MTSRAVRIALAAAVLGAGACELEEVTIVDPQDVVVAEALVQIGDGADAPTRVTVFLHRTLGPGGESRPVPGARVVLTRADGFSLELAEGPPELCVVTTPVDGTGSCYWAAAAGAGRLGAGDTVDLDVALPSGGRLTSRTRVPGGFAMAGLPAGGRCRIPPDTPVELAWSRSEGAWAYIGETLIEGLRAALAPRGIEVAPEDDPLYLLGLSVSATDTTIVFPAEFGVFNRFELDQALALALQRGLPAGTRAAVTVAAADRNYVNWVRGGNFNPSGQVRIPSVQGDGTGVFGSVVVRSLHIVTDSLSLDTPCPFAPQ